MRKWMDRLEAMAMFLTAIEKGNLSAAAREMRVPVPTLSRKVADLELLLKTKLLTRTTRQLILTDAGVAYAAAARRVLEQVDEAERQAAGEFTDFPEESWSSRRPCSSARGQMPLKMRRFLDFAAPRLRKALAAISSAA